MFNIRFDFDFNAYKKDIKRYKRLNTKPYYFSDQQRGRIEEACKLLARLSPLLAQPGPLRNRLVKEWFNTAGHASLFLYLVKLNNVIKS